MNDGFTTTGPISRRSQAFLISRLFYSPAEVFRSLVETPTWWLPFLLSSICTYTLAALLVLNVGIPELAHRALDSSISSSQSSEALAAKQHYAEIALSAGFVLSPLLLIIILAVLSFILWISINGLLGGEALFSAVFSVVVFANLVQSIKVMMTCAALYGAGVSERFNQDNPIGTNLGFFLNDTVDSRVKALLSAFDLVTFWHLILLVIGCSIASGVSRKRVALLILAGWGLLVLARVAWVGAAA